MESTTGRLDRDIYTRKNHHVFSPGQALRVIWEGVLEPWPTDTLNPYLSRVIPRDLGPELQYPELTEHGTQQLPNYYSLPLTQIDNHGAVMVPIIE